MLKLLQTLNHNIGFGKKALHSPYVSGADNLNNSSNPDISIKFGKKHPYVILFQINHDPHKIVKVTINLKMPPKSHPFFGWIPNKRPSSLLY